jgi:hypothetical protein
MDGLPGATTRLGAMMAYKGLSPSESWMRADIHDGPEQRLHLEAEYIDAALTFVGPPTSSCDARPDHTSGTRPTKAELPFWIRTSDVPVSERTSLPDPEEIYKMFFLYGRTRLWGVTRSLI